MDFHNNCYQQRHSRVDNSPCDAPTDSAKLLKKGFLDNYKSPYLITDTFLKFRSQGA